jgi:argininosuccinate synthase
MDRNLLHISYEAGILEDPWFEPTSRTAAISPRSPCLPEDAPDKPST